MHQQVSYLFVLTQYLEFIGSDEKEESWLVGTNGWRMPLHGKQDVCGNSCGSRWRGGSYRSIRVKECRAVINEACIILH